VKFEKVRLCKHISGNKKIVFCKKLSISMKAEHAWQQCINCEFFEPDIEKFQRILRKAWSIETCYPREKSKWTPEKPEVGQCFVTALVVSDYLGGKIAYNKKLDHYFNILDDGTVIDFTKEQFNDLDKIKIDIILTPETLKQNSSNDTIHRYMLLKAKVDKMIKNKLLR